MPPCGSAAGERKGLSGPRRVFSRVSRNTSEWGHLRALKVLEHERGRGLSSSSSMHLRLKATVRNGRASDADLCFCAQVFLRVWSTEGQRSGHGCHAAHQAASPWQLQITRELSLQQSCASGSKWGHDVAEPVSKPEVGPAGSGMMQPGWQLAVLLAFTTRGQETWGRSGQLEVWNECSPA